MFFATIEAVSMMQAVDSLQLQRLASRVHRLYRACIALAHLAA
ncbi:hypothetical protein BN2476_640038 [Paraburkholderia piptadeniae]|uniref:Uncharacterized protein n=1 Tax=Paraburkholderia piptadeniae TaxID=1701573 RepID=A0A1N7SM63_9BURK|nr:hypothetical protein BN2476_640038 [Paraburkholderia piptadeniae]